MSNKFKKSNGDSENAAEYSSELKKFLKTVKETKQIKPRELENILIMSDIDPQITNKFLAEVYSIADLNIIGESDINFNIFKYITDCDLLS